MPWLCAINMFWTLRTLSRRTAALALMGNLSLRHSSMTELILSHRQIWTFLSKIAIWSSSSCVRDGSWGMNDFPNVILMHSAHPLEEIPLCERDDVYNMNL